MIVGYTWWMNYNLETKFKFSETALCFDEKGDSKVIEVEFDVIILQNKYKKNYKLLGDVTIDDRVYSYGNGYGFLVYNIEKEYFVGFSPTPDNELELGERYDDSFRITWNYIEENGIIELFSESKEVIYFPYNGKSEKKVLDEISYLKTIKFKIE